MPARRPTRALAAACALLLAACDEEAPKAAPPPPAVNVAKPLKKAVQAWVHATGNVAALDRVELRAQVSGFLTEKTFTDGQVVAAGAPLFVIDPALTRSGATGPRPTWSSRRWRAPRPRCGWSAWRRR